MKKILILVGTTIFVVVVLPAIVIFFTGTDAEQMQTVHTKDKHIKVLIGTEVMDFELEDYLYGVLAGEMPASFHEEALKAQAVAARTYILNKCDHVDAAHPQADVCTDSTHCKAYLDEEAIRQQLGEGWEKEYGDRMRSAISATAGEIAVYNGQAIEAVFHSTGSGVTENAKDVWGGDVPYLTSVESPGDTLSPKYYSEVTVPLSQLQTVVSENAGFEVAPYAGEVVLNDSGSVNTIDLGGIVFKGTQIREMFSLPSTNFTVENKGDYLLFKCHGKGHGVGMSQYGAEYFAENGMSYTDILKTYYKGVEIVKHEGYEGNSD